MACPPGYSRLTRRDESESIRVPLSKDCKCVCCTVKMRYSLYHMSDWVTRHTLVLYYYPTIRSFSVHLLGLRPIIMQAARVTTNHPHLSFSLHHPISSQSAPVCLRSLVTDVLDGLCLCEPKAAIMAWSTESACGLLKAIGAQVKMIWR